MPIPERFLDELIARTDIVDLVGEYVRLTKKGRNYWGLCPFHSEKTPSFSVSPDKQIFKCFGCGKGGGAINFIMELDSLPFRDAVGVLAKRVNLEVPDTGGFSAGMKERREKLLTVRPGGGGGAGLPSEARAEPGDPDPVRTGLRPRPLGRSADGPGGAGVGQGRPAGRRAGGEQQGRPHL